ncbi:type I-F CRISPR-associated helicase Cas3 [Nitrosomonas sp. JL21]|uniref:type I-F CRISPR-associated helicase Cas3f n=1 Tax=Nitrosomonas sp. JL21 TaxID=153949 RepID=UPI00136D0754|nr:type I-F CRISPR-associated helicase Cas3f [Nitrosomonas sp. JL21]MBL8497120.1 type I-F CRISPR-associated helicase Cas3 [Nitrosomonas sp.]MXS76589.1 type I-F CRISPR-associated helicase Cas3 [Nitrosomonas sp. JL21]
MMVTFVSQCEKKALNRTRRVLDAFANRIGDNTWQTVITEEGLIAVKTLLRKTATKNTAVACHWIRSRSRSELVWIVGNRKRFNAEGGVPVNSTKKDLSHREWEKGWHTTEIITTASAIAGLFHDLGKANDLFQDKLNQCVKEKNTKRFEPYRHEWVSLRIFQAFVSGRSDQEWLKQLADIDEDLENHVIQKIIIDNPDSDKSNNPFATLPTFARLVAWLVVSHHRLPVYPKLGNTEPSFDQADKWLILSFDESWNSINSQNHKWEERILKANWTFSYRTPLASKTWQKRASELSRRALICPGLMKVDWFCQPFVMHLSRLALMLADHHYSAKDAQTRWQDSNYQAFANTNEQRQPKQKLDEHNVGVSQHAFEFSLKFRRLREELPSLNDNRTLTKGPEEDKEPWQVKAYQAMQQIQSQAKEQGFFGINMASTGRGKTLANARIMYGLADESEGCRFSVALGLRTLTLQTGDALQERLKLDKTDIATLIGSQAILQLNQINQGKQTEDGLFAMRGSESLELGLDDDGFDVIYNTEFYEGQLEKWFPNNRKAKKLLHAPILVSTIDHLTPATEGVRGGRQIVPMLRLLTSDLVLDEPDEFDLNDLPALTRLVNWAGMLGAKVLLSTATMPPALAYALFEAYQEGRKAFNTATNQAITKKSVVCAWCDEFSVQVSEQENIQSYIKAHDEFIQKRITKLNQDNSIFRKAKLLEIAATTDLPPLNTMSVVIRQGMVALHQGHHQQHASGKKVSIGLVRIANINPLVAIAKLLYTYPVPENFRIHYCIYHSQYPLAQRAFIESKLDQALNRKDQEAIWNCPEIQHALSHYPEQDQIFVVLATSVAEVGRDHDYDWAIAEPSSMRSIIQIAGRIQRHRKQVPETENFYILAKNYKALKGKELAYEKPGFESKHRKLRSHDLDEVLNNQQYAVPRATPSIFCPPLNKESRKPPFQNLVVLEHMAYREILLGDNEQQNNARIWWKNQVSWCAEIQRKQPFRASSPDQAYCLYLEADDDKPIWQIKNENVSPSKYETTTDIVNIDLTPANGNQPWFDFDLQDQYGYLAEQFEKSLKYISYCFGEIRLPDYENQINEWYYSPMLGVFREIRKE